MLVKSKGKILQNFAAFSEYMNTIGIINQKQIWRQILSDLPTYLHQISSDAAWIPKYLSKNLTSYVNAPYAGSLTLDKKMSWNKYQI